MSYLAYSYPTRNSSGIILKNFDNRVHNPKFQEKPASSGSKAVDSTLCEIEKQILYL